MRVVLDVVPGTSKFFIERKIEESMEETIKKIPQDRAKIDIESKSYIEFLKKSLSRENHESCFNEEDKDYEKFNEITKNLYDSRYFSEKETIFIYNLISKQKSKIACRNVSSSTEEKKIIQKEKFGPGMDPTELDPSIKWARTLLDFASPWASGYFISKKINSIKPGNDSIMLNHMNKNVYKNDESAYYIKSIRNLLILKENNLIENGKNSIDKEKLKQITIKLRLNEFLSENEKKFIFDLINSYGKYSDKEKQYKFTKPVCPELSLVLF